MDSSVTARLASYQRLEHNGVGIYVHPDYPDWFVPTSMADGLLRSLSNDGSLDEAARGDSDIGRSGYALERFVARLVRGDSASYAGRAAHLKLKRLRECWFHVTNRCNLRCGHCMFSSGPARRQQLAPEQLRESVSEARRLGCEVFYFTGGEPLIYPELLPVCREILSDAK
ncbi:MAG: radical SAM protein, partial [Planctomycetota bacterium]